MILLPVLSTACGYNQNVPAASIQFKFPTPTPISGQDWNTESPDLLYSLYPTPTPTPTPIPTPTPLPLPKPRVVAEAQKTPPPNPNNIRVWSREEIIAELQKYDWPIAGAIATIQCESGFNQFARNPYSGARGLFQDINGDPSLDDPAVAIYRGYLKWLDGGRSFYTHWTRWGGCGAGY